MRAQKVVGHATRTPFVGKTSLLTEWESLENFEQSPGHNMYKDKIEQWLQTSVSWFVGLVDWVGRGTKRPVLGNKKREDEWLPYTITLP